MELSVALSRRSISKEEFGKCGIGLPVVALNSSRMVLSKRCLWMASACILFFLHNS